MLPFRHPNFGGPSLILSAPCHVLATACQLNVTLDGPLIGPPWRKKPPLKTNLSQSPPELLQILSPNSSSLRLLLVFPFWWPKSVLGWVFFFSSNLRGFLSINKVTHYGRAICLLPSMSLPVVQHMASLLFSSILFMSSLMALLYPMLKTALELGP